jgi:phosphatidylglycerol---prolipoprotein diacylglyceryl transferase
MTFLGYITWNVNPDIFHLGPLTIRWYGLLFAMAFLVGYIIMENVYKTEHIAVKEVDRLSLHMILGVVIGARLGHVLFYQPDYYFAHPLDILKIWEGGLASHGAAIGILIAIYIYTRKGPVRSYMWMLDRIILTVPIGGFFVRMGNLMNSEIYGHVTNLPWGFYFVRDAAFDHMPHHPTQIYEGLLYLLLFVFLFILYKKKHASLKPGTLFGLFLILLFSIRFFVEFFKEVQVGFENNLIANYGLNLGQLLSIPFILIGIFILIRSMRLKTEEKI